MSTASALLLPAAPIVTGDLVTFDEQRPEVRDGALSIDRDGRIVAVAEASAQAAAGF